MCSLRVSFGKTADAVQCCLMLRTHFLVAGVIKQVVSLAL